VATNIKKANVFVVDDDANYRSVLTSFLSNSGFVVKSFESAEEFLACKAISRPCCLLLDVYMPGMSGLELQEKLHSTGVRIPIVFLSGQSDIPIAVKAMKNYAVDFLCKPFNKEELIEVIERAIEKEHLYSFLSPRERETLLQIVSGNTNQVTAEKLGITLSTVKDHRLSIMTKLNVKSFAELIQFAERLGIRVVEN